MKQISIITIIISGLILASCSSKSPEFVNSIPDNAIAVVSMHPMKIYTKGKLSSMESLKKKMEGEIWGQILENPLSSGMMLDEYVYMFASMEEETPVLGVVAGIRDMGKFENMLRKIDEEIESEFVEMEGYKYFRPDQEGIIAWNEDQMVVLGSFNEEFETSFWASRLNWMFSPIKEESILSMVDFKDFQANMKDINMWLSSEDMTRVIEKIAKSRNDDLPMDLPMDFPINLANNYSHVFCDFSDGAMNITGKTNFSEEVQKNIDEVLVLNSSLNPDLLKMAPGGNLLLALAVSSNLEKVQNLVEKIAPPQLDGMGNKVEEATGIPAQTLLNAFTGDFTLSVNGLKDEAMIPVEVFIGLGVKSDEIQNLLLEQVKNMVPVEEQGDFFVINLQGNEIYSGIINDNWVITNVKGYKEKVKSGKLSESLLDSKFADFSDKSMGMYLNLDLDTYPATLQEMLEHSGDRKAMIEKLTGSLDYIGMAGGDNEGLMTVKTSNPNENSLYSLIRIGQAEE